MATIIHDDGEIEYGLRPNPFKGYLENLRAKSIAEGKNVNYVHEVVNMYYKMYGYANMPKTFYKGRWGYGKLASEAKALIENCKGNLDDALWCLDKMKYIAEKKKFDWSISTCLKHDLHSFGI